MFFSYKNRVALYIFLAILFLFFDRLLKSVAVRGLANSKNLIKDFFTFTFTPNYNIAFSLPLSGIWLNILILVIIIGLLYYFIYLFDKSNKNAYYIGFVLLGAISNFYDRVVYGFVIDYFDLKYFTVFNFADIMIVVGCLLVLKNEFKKNEFRKIKN